MISGHARGRGSRVARQRLLSDTAGVAIVEFVVAIVPILVFFFCIAQLSVLAYVQLVVKHSAFVAARGEAVIHPQMPDSGSESDVKTGVMMLLGVIPGVGVNDVNVQTQLAGQYDQTLDTVTVTLNYKCTVPFASAIVCSGGNFSMQASASFPNQGSTYQKIWE